MSFKDIAIILYYFGMLCYIMNYEKNTTLQALISVLNVFKVIKYRPDKEIYSSGMFKSQL